MPSKHKASNSSIVSPRKRKRTAKEHPQEFCEPDEESALQLTAQDAETVENVLETAGISSSTVIDLLSNKIDIADVIRQTGFSQNYIMSLQRKVLRQAEGLRLREPATHNCGDVKVHVLFDDVHEQAMFIRKELFTALSMSGTSFSYWRKRAGVSEMDTSMDFRLMDQCRTIFGGRATYTLYTAQDTLTILNHMANSRLKKYSNYEKLRRLVAHYCDNYYYLPSCDDDGDTAAAPATPTLSLSSDEFSFSSDEFSPSMVAITTSAYPTPTSTPVPTSLASSSSSIVLSPDTSDATTTSLSPSPFTDEMDVPDSLDGSDVMSSPSSPAPMFPSFSLLLEDFDNEHITLLQLPEPSCSASVL